MVTFGGSNTSSQGSGSSNQQTQYTPTAEETAMNRLYLGQMQEMDPTTRALNQQSGSDVLNLLRGQDLPGNLGKLSGGITDEQTAQMSSRAIKDIQPFMSQAGILDSGVNAQISARTSAELEAQGV